MRVLDGVIRVEWSFHKKRKGGGLNFYLNEGSAKNPVSNKSQPHAPFICIK